MTATVAPSPWSASAQPGRSPWRFGGECELEQGRGLRWVLPRNCSLTPRQLMAAYLAMCAISLAVAALFWWLGATMVVAFAGTELLLVGVALLLYARHAADRETLTLAAGSLVVEHRCGARTERMEFRASWLRVEPSRGQGSLVELSGQGRRMRVGRYLRPELRLPLAEELRRAVRATGPGSPPLRQDMGLD